VPLSHDILLDDTAFTTASSEMDALETRTKKLKNKLKGMYEDLSTALDTPAGKAVELKADKVLLQPIEDLLLVIQHVSSTLTEINGTRHYKDVFIKYEELDQSINP